MSRSSQAARVFLIRHAETEWSRTLRHTGREDIPLTESGRRDAADLGPRLAAESFARVLSSPLSRAADTCRLAGLGERAELHDELVEWDYGDYEGRTTADIREERPDWNLWRDGCPGGEQVTEVGARLDPLIAGLATLDGDAVLFAHGHVLRILAARWLELPAHEGARLVLGAASISILGFEREARALLLWNDTRAG